MLSLGGAVTIYRRPLGRELSRGGAICSVGRPPCRVLSPCGAVTSSRRPLCHELSRSGAICSVGRPPGHELSSGGAVSCMLLAGGLALSGFKAPLQSTASQCRRLVLASAETGDGEPSPPPARGVAHGQEQLVLVVLLLHYPAEVKDAFVLDVISAQAVQLQREVLVAQQLGHVHGHRRGLLVLP
ncbi:hypothetical protein E2C01_042477 [Portunus trituberculatus]|uniref:Uncharacterized protein n=1 Tax=Portunus trituberculatus TaxID=210409 RepID=A0A5B7FT60_PORTR|nr:hypothetical protein [Portunus trituberculatus]